LYDQIKNKVKTSRQIADEQGVHLNTITKWRKVFGIPSDFSSEQAPPSDKITLPDYDKIHKEIKEAGGIGVWAQKEAVELFCFSKHLLDQVNRVLIEVQKSGDTGTWVTGLFKAITQLSKCASQLKELMPSRSNIDFSDPTHRISEQDEKAINALNGILDMVKKDALPEETNKTKGWYSPEEEVPIKMSNANSNNR
jgi:hypothetical protein